MQDIRNKIKNLTPEQCVEIAKIGVNEIKWKFIKSEHGWDGHDLIPEDKKEGIPSYVFQIDYREDASSIVRFYDEFGNEYHSVNIFPILDYINSL